MSFIVTHLADFFHTITTTIFHTQTLRTEDPVLTATAIPPTTPAPAPAPAADADPVSREGTSEAGLPIFHGQQVLNQGSMARMSSPIPLPTVTMYYQRLIARWTDLRGRGTFFLSVSTRFRAANDATPQNQNRNRNRNRVRHRIATTVVGNTALGEERRRRSDLIAAGMGFSRGLCWALAAIVLLLGIAALATTTWQRMKHRTSSDD